MPAPFLGRGWSFPPRFDPRTKQVQMVSEEEDIRESLRILLGTHPGERMMQPAYGCALRNHVFGPLDEQGLTELTEEVKRAILFFEPRIRLEALRAERLDPMGGTVSLVLDYSIRTTNTRHNLVFPLYLHEGSAPVQGG